jgi:NAD(P)-dependent dehydrogenase (short-subunit alcohol dehydrogenase family)
MSETRRKTPARKRASKAPAVAISPLTQRGVFVTGATGFIGRHLVSLLLKRTGGPIHVLVRSASLGRLEARRREWKDVEGRVHAIIGDVSEPGLGIAAHALEKLRGEVGHFFHVAGLYDMTASDADLQRTNVAGTEEAVRIATGIQALRFHHVSSIAAAGRFPGRFDENMFDEAVGLDDPYFRTKHDSERVVRDECTIPWRIYRPSLVVGHSESGAMDKVDGPYYLFPTLERLAAALPSLLPLPGIDGGTINLVPVDYVAAAIDHIAHREGLDNQVFHLVDPDPYTVGETLNIFAEAAGAPRFSIRVPGSETALAPLTRALSRSSGSRPGNAIENVLGIPLRALDYVSNPTTFDASNTEAALLGSGIEVPRLEAYARNLWLFWQRHLNTNTEYQRGLGRAVRGRTVLITGASAGIGKATALKLGAAGAHVLLVARDAQRLDEVRLQVERVGGKANILPLDVTDQNAVDAMVEDVIERFGGIDVLVNNAGRSIRRSLRISHNRFHDFERTMEINYFAALRLIMGFLPSMRRRRRGHIVNVSSIGVQVGPPRFSAYIASKAALDGFSKCAAPELVGDGIDITTVYMPLVKTEMIAPTRLYDSFSMITPAQAADLICTAIVHRPKHVGTTLGLIGQVASSIAPGVTDVALHLAYRLFPDSAAARGEVPVQDEQPSSIAKVFARLLPGVHW